MNCSWFDGDNARILSSSSLFALTFLDQLTEGTGLPDALHSIDTDPPCFTVNWPLDGTIRIVGGTAGQMGRRVEEKVGEVNIN